MARPVRWGSTVLILMAEGFDDTRALVVARGACRLAQEAGLEPVCVYLLYGAYLSEGELRDDQVLKDRALKWFYRLGQVWVCVPKGVATVVDVELGVVAFSVLFRNEAVISSGLRGYLKRAGNDFNRRPISLVLEREEGLVVKRASRKALAKMLQANVVPGLLRG